MSENAKPGTSERLKKYQVVPNDGGSITIFFDASMPSSYTTVNAGGRIYSTVDGGNSFINQLSLGSDVLDSLPGHYGIEVSGSITIRPLRPTGSNKNSDTK